MAAVPFQLTIRTIHGDQLFKTLVDYDRRTLNEFSDEIRPFYGLVWLASNFFKKAYGRNRTSGLDIKCSPSLV